MHVSIYDGFGPVVIFGYIDFEVIVLDLVDI